MGLENSINRIALNSSTNKQVYSCSILNRDMYKQNAVISTVYSIKI